MEAHLGHGISIDRVMIKMCDFNNEDQVQRAKESHHDQGHTFYIVEKGSLVIEIDFQRHEIKAPSLVCMSFR